MYATNRCIRQEEKGKQRDKTVFDNNLLSLELNIRVTMLACQDDFSCGIRITV